MYEGFLCVLLFCFSKNVSENQFCRSQCYLFFFSLPTRCTFKFHNLSIKHSVVIITHTLDLSKRIPTKWQT